MATVVRARQDGIRQASNRSVMNNEADMDGVVVAGQPTDEELRELPARGVAVLVNLRPAGEFVEPEAPKVPAGVKYVDIPFDGRSISDEHVHEMRAALDAATGPVIVHCAGGTRAALVVGMAQAEKAGEGSEGALRRIHAAGFDVVGTPYGAFLERYFAKA
jgi:uncharacterized protein (TIGR01244 family)